MTRFDSSVLLFTEEPILQPGRIDVLLRQRRTAEVLRNLCFIVRKDAPDDWQEITRLMQRLFNVELADPVETARGSIELEYRQPGVKQTLDEALDNNLTSLLEGRALALPPEKQLRDLFSYPKATATATYPPRPG